MTIVEPKRLYRSVKNKVLCGVCGGIGEYFQIDPVMIRLIWIFLMMFQTWRNLFHWFTGLSRVGGSLILYIIAAAIIPKAPEN